jgi:putative tryptophan/tyrosine transport system substrate-binding protein
VQLLKEVLPKMQRLAVIWDSTSVTAVSASEDTLSAAHKLGLRVQPIPIMGADEIERSLDLAAKQRADAVIVIHSPLMVMHRKQVAQFALKRRLPLMSAPSQFPEAGALISYGPDLSKFFKRAAIFVDKILKGAIPADIPVEQPTKIDLVVNMNTAKALGIKVPNSILVRADRIID